MAGLGDREESAPMEWKPSQQMGSLYGARQIAQIAPYFPFSSNGLLDKGAQVQNVVTTVSSLGDRLPQRQLGILGSEACSEVRTPVSRVHRWTPTGKLWFEEGKLSAKKNVA